MVCGTISLLVGGIVIMNIMLASFNERVREVGTRKALGASPLHIAAQFLVESVVVTMAGGVDRHLHGNRLLPGHGGSPPAKHVRDPFHDGHRVFLRGGGRDALRLLSRGAGGQALAGRSAPVRVMKTPTRARPVFRPRCSRR